MASSATVGARGGRSLGTVVLATVLATLILNGLLFALGWAGPSVDAAHRQPLLPPGWVIGGVWVVLLALLAVAYWLLANGAPAGRRLAPWVVVLIAGCLAYPFYTFGLRSEVNALIGNLATIAGGALLAGRAAEASWRAAGLVLLTVAWVAFATFATFVPAGG